MSLSGAAGLPGPNQLVSLSEPAGDVAASEDAGRYETPGDREIGDEQASVTVVVPSPSATPDAGSGGSEVSQVVAGELGIPSLVLGAYVKAANQVAAEDPSCGIRWEILAGIGKVESGHAGGGRVTPDGDTRPRILGPVLNGNGFAAIRDSDGGRWDGDDGWDRAVGPMQFIPGTWKGYGADGSGDGVVDPHNVFDATLAAARYLCAGSSSLSTDAGLRAALLRYNNSSAYVATVLSWIRAYESGSGYPTSTPGPGPEDLAPAAPAPATDAPNPSGTPDPDPTSSPKPSGKPSPSGTAKPSKTPKPKPTSTATEKPTPTPTKTATPDPTQTPEPTGTPKPTPTPTKTPTPTPTNDPPDEPEDATPPTVTATLDGPGADPAFTGAVTVSLAATDEHSEVTSIEYRLDGGAWTAYSEPFTVKALGDHKLEYRATDSAGNMSGPGSKAFTIRDATPPTVTATLDGPGADPAFTGAVTVSLAATDEQGEVTSIEYRLDGGAWTAYSEPFTVKALGDHKLEYRATDGAGNMSEPGSKAFTISEPTEDPDCPASDPDEEATATENSEAEECAAQDSPTTPEDARQPAQTPRVTTGRRRPGVRD